MTLPASGALILGSQTGATNSINNAFGLGNDMASYRGAYYGKGSSEYQFPVIGNPIDIDLFHGAYNIAGGSESFSSSDPSYIVPVYNKITITCTGGQGGQEGYWGYDCSGNRTIVSLTGGGAGYTSSFGGYCSGGGGNGGSGQYGGGATGAYPSAVVRQYTNPTQGGTGPVSGSPISVVVGGGGNGGHGAATRIYDFYGHCYYPWPDSYAPGGNGGSVGSVTITWS
jgi:hypothetical protein